MVPRTKVQLVQYVRSERFAPLLSPDPEMRSMPRATTWRLHWPAERNDRPKGRVRSAPRPFAPLWPIPPFCAGVGPTSAVRARTVDDLAVNAGGRGGGGLQARRAVGRKGRSCAREGSRPIRSPGPPLGSVVVPTRQACGGAPLPPMQKCKPATATCPRPRPPASFRVVSSRPVLGGACASPLREEYGRGASRGEGRGGGKPVPLRPTPAICPRGRERRHRGRFRSSVCSSQPSGRSARTGC